MALQHIKWVEQACTFITFSVKFQSPVEVALEFLHVELKMLWHSHCAFCVPLHREPDLFAKISHCLLRV